MSEYPNEVDVDASIDEIYAKTKNTNIAKTLIIIVPINILTITTN